MATRSLPNDDDFVIGDHEKAAVPMATQVVTDSSAPYVGETDGNVLVQCDNSTESEAGPNGGPKILSNGLPLLNTKSRGSPTVQQSELNTRNAEYQEAWEEEMEGVGTTGAPHKRTAVLMISWDKSLDDLDTAGEVDDLGDVFEQKFRYTVVKKQLTDDKPPVNQLRKHISDFIYDHDSPFTLLILYYAGHGTTGKPGELHFTASGIPQQKRSFRNSVPWLRLEPSFDDVLGDILLIFDCCHAGSLVSQLDIRRGYFPTKSFEYFAACRGDSLTHPPGPKSFTRALIYAFEELLKVRGKFTTHELQTETGNAPNFPKDQHAQVLDRGPPSDQRLVLAPIPLPTSNGKLDNTDPDASTTRAKEYLDLRFWYVKKPDVNEVKEVASQLKKLIVEEKILTNRIAWIKLGDVTSIESSKLTDVRSIVEKWKSRSIKSPRASLSPNPNFDVSSRVYDQILLITPPPSISGDSDMSCIPTGRENEDVSKHNITLRSSKSGETRSVKVSENGRETVLVISSRNSFVRITQFANVAILNNHRLKHPGIALFMILFLFYAFNHRPICPSDGC